MILFLFLKGWDIFSVKKFIFGKKLLVRFHGVSNLQTRRRNIISFLSNLPTIESQMVSPLREQPYETAGEGGGGKNWLVTQKGYTPSLCARKKSIPTPPTPHSSCFIIPSEG